MKGKENDVKLAIKLRDSFIMQYNDDKTFDKLLSELEKHYTDRLIHRLSKEIKINIVKYYEDLKQILIAIRQHHAREIFIHICKIDDARSWVNDNGKYSNLVFEAVYSLYKKDQEVLKWQKE